MAAASNEPLELRPDLDATEPGRPSAARAWIRLAKDRALSPERDALWSRLEKTTFLTPDEKRAAIGYAPLGPGGVKYRPDQARDRIGRWTRESGGLGWALAEGSPGFDLPPGNSDVLLSDPIGEADWGGGGSNQEAILLAQSAPDDRYTVRLEEEVPYGGHALRDHVGKTDQELIATLEAKRHRTFFLTIAKPAQGSFFSIEAANDFTNRVIENNQTQVDLVANGQKEAWLFNRFGYVRGKEAFREDADAPPYVRPTYEVGVLIRHDARRSRGYSVETAYPFNRRGK